MWSLSSLLLLSSVAAAAATVQSIGHNVNNSVTVVSGYWTVRSKHSSKDYSKWLLGALGLHCPLVFFHDDQGVVSMVTKARARMNLPTTFVNRPVEEAADKFHYDPTWVHPVHVNNRLLATIWLDKVFMLAEAATLNRYNSEWFVWNDAGNAFYRVRRLPPRSWPTPELLPLLPTDKIIYTDSNDHPNHSFAGTSFMYHISMVFKVRDMFMASYEACVTRMATEDESLRWHCGIDQRLFSVMKDQQPEMFLKIGRGYGTLVHYLFAQKLENHTQEPWVSPPPQRSAPKRMKKQRPLDGSSLR